MPNSDSVSEDTITKDAKGKFLAVPMAPTNLALLPVGSYPPPVHKVQYHSREGSVRLDGLWKTLPTGTSLTPLSLPPLSTLSLSLSPLSLFAF